MGVDKNIQTYFFQTRIHAHISICKNLAQSTAKNNTNSKNIIELEK